MKPRRLISVWNIFCVAGTAFFVVFHLSASAQAQTRRGLFTSPLTSETEPAIHTPESPAPEIAHHGEGGAQNSYKNPSDFERQTQSTPIKHLANERNSSPPGSRSKQKKAKKADHAQQRDQSKFLDFLATGAIQVTPRGNNLPAEPEKIERNDNAQASANIVSPEPPSVNLNAIAKQYCSAIAQTASDARIAWQEKHIHELEDALNKRADELNARIDEFRSLIAKHDDAIQKADDNVVAIYAKMKPESAALQLAAMDENAAAAILAKLNARGAGAILNEMPPEKAAHLTSIMSLRKAPVKEEKKAS